LIIAIDYDGTYSAHPSLFDKAIKLFQEGGHTVICITNRTSTVKKHEIVNSIGQLVPVIFAGSDWKKDAAIANGYRVDVWLDDNPSSIEKQILIGKQ
jgi:hypothetical protein